MTSITKIITKVSNPFRQMGPISTSITIIAIMMIIYLTSCYATTDNKKLQAVKSLPVFRIITFDSSTCINTENIPTGNPIVFIYFDPDCEHCQKEAKEISTHMSALRNTRIYFLTNGEAADAKLFLRLFKINTINNVMVGKDYEYSFYRTFLPPTVPYIAIYNSRRRLVKLYEGETNIDFIIKSVQD